MEYVYGLVGVMTFFKACTYSRALERERERERERWAREREKRRDYEGVHIFCDFDCFVHIFCFVYQNHTCK